MKQTAKPYTFGRIIRHSFTGRDNQTIDIGRVIWALAAFVYFMFSGYGLYFNHVFSALEWSGGISTILAAGGLGIKLKAETEPAPEKGTREDTDDDDHDHDKGEKK